FFFSSRRRHTRFSRDWSSDVCSSDLSLRSAGSQSPLGFFQQSETGLVNQIQDLLEPFVSAVIRIWHGLAAQPVALQEQVKIRARSEERRVGKESRARRYTSACRRTPR